MLIQHRERRPTVDATVFVAPTAVLIGNVSLGPRSRVMSGAVLDSEGSRVEVGECVIVYENAVLRATADWTDRLARYEQATEVRSGEFCGARARQNAGRGTARTRAVTEPQPPLPWREPPPHQVITHHVVNGPVAGPRHQAGSPRGRSRGFVVHESRPSRPRRRGRPHRAMRAGRKVTLHYFSRTRPKGDTLMGNDATVP